MLPTIPLLQHPPSHYHYATQCSRLVFASQARCHVHVLHASCGKCPTTPLLKHCTLIIIYPDPVLPTIPPLQHSPPQYLKISLQSMMAANVRCVSTIRINLRPGATLSCMKFSTTPLPHGYNTSWSIFGQKPVSLSMSSLPVVGSVPAHLHLMVTTHIHNQYSARTRSLSASVPDLHTSPPAPALSTSSSQLILAHNKTSVQFVFISNTVWLSVSSLFYFSPSLTMSPSLSSTLMLGHCC